MIKEKLKDLEIKITELADYLQLSRTTLYKFIDCYDLGKKDEVNPIVCKLFDYIENNDLIGKKNVINYILNNMATIQEDDTDEVNFMVSKIKKYISENPMSEKTQFILQSVETSQFDIVIHYLLEITSLLKKGELDNNDKNKLKPYLNVIDFYSIKEEK